MARSNEDRTARMWTRPGMPEMLHKTTWEKVKVDLEKIVARNGGT